MIGFLRPVDLENKEKLQRHGMKLMEHSVSPSSFESHKNALESPGRSSPHAWRSRSALNYFAPAGFHLLEGVIEMKDAY